MIQWSILNKRNRAVEYLFGLARALCLPQSPPSATRTFVMSSGGKINNERDMSEVNDWQAWRSADAVCFDVDSTVIREEGLDGLAEYLQKGEDVRTITMQAMGGKLSFREALAKRLEIIQPTLSQMEEFSSKRAFSLTPGVQELITKLQTKQVPVYLISGGFLRLILPVAKSLGIPESNVFCNKVIFDDEGRYANFDPSAYTADTGGKGRVIADLIEQNSYKNVAMIGDGATDMEASPPAHMFIGFGGNVCRPAVREAAKLFVMSFDVLSEALG